MTSRARSVALVIAFLGLVGTNPAVSLAVTKAQHEHTASLAICDGELCVILHHSEDHDPGGVSLHESDHELKLIDQHASLSSVRVDLSDQLIGPAETSPVFADPMSATRLSACPAESPPTVHPERSTILRI